MLYTMILLKRKENKGNNGDPNIYSNLVLILKIKI